VLVDWAQGTFKEERLTRAFTRDCHAIRQKYLPFSIFETPLSNVIEEMLAIPNLDAQPAEDAESDDEAQTLALRVCIGNLMAMAGLNLSNI
jgi:hypothetical protein